MINQEQIAYVLASASPRRKELLSFLSLSQTYQYVVETDETILSDWVPAEAVMQLAVKKGNAVLSQLPNMEQPFNTNTSAVAIISADTIVVRDNVILGKPKDEADAFEMLASLQGRSHEVYTGLALLKSEHPYIITKDERLFHMAHVVEQQTKEHFSTHTSLNNFGEIGSYLSIVIDEQTNTEVYVGYTRSKVTFRPLTTAQIHDYIKTGDPLDKAGSYGIQGVGAVNIESIEGDFYSVMGLPLSLLHHFFSKSK